MDNSLPSEFTQLMQAAQQGNELAEQAFCEKVNQELRQVAERVVRGAQAQPTSLVNELFVRLFRKAVVPDLKNRRYFFAVAADQMRQILRERIRAKLAQKRGGGMERVPLDIALDQYLDDFQAQNRFAFQALDEALERLREGKSTARQYEVVRLRFLVGLTIDETADVLGIAPRTVRGDWLLARAKLLAELSEDAG